jgi:hypothetical protein
MGSAHANYWDREPDFVNDEGVQWWREDDLCWYARSRGLTDVSAWIVRNPDGSMARLILDGDRVDYECTSLEAAADHILFMSLADKPKE